jgi:putative MATE family efflux protein
VLQKIKNLFGAQDMTVGSPTKNIAKFAIPLLIGNLAQQLYSTVDSIVVGKYCSVELNGYTGVDALAAVGASGPIINLLLVLFVAISTGAGILVAQYFGARDRERLSHCIGTSVILITVTSVIIMVVGIPLAGPLLRAINTPPAYFELARAYLVIIFAGILGGGFYNIISGILRGMGDSFYPLVFLIVAAVLNIILDIVFVANFRMGVHGVALATILAQAVSAVLCIIRLAHMKNVITLNRRSLIPNVKMSSQILKLGLPSGVTQAVFSLAMVFVQSLTNQMGDFVPAISVAVMRVDGFAMMPNFTFGLAISTYIGQNIGAGRQDRIKPGERACLKLALCISALLVLCLVLWGGNLIDLFINAETTSPDVYEKVVSIGTRALRILAVGYLAMAITQVYGGILRAAGDTVSPMVISIVTTVAVRIPIAYAMAYFTRSDEWAHGHPDALFFSLLISWVLGAVLTYLRYRQGKWKNIKLV